MAINAVNDVPDSFKDWVKDNAGRIEKAVRRGTLYRAGCASGRAQRQGGSAHKKSGGGFAVMRDFPTFAPEGVPPTADRDAHQ